MIQGFKATAAANEMCKLLSSKETTCLGRGLHEQLIVDFLADKMCERFVHEQLTAISQVDKTQLMDVLKEEPSFSHDHFNDVKAASEGQAEPPEAPADTGQPFFHQ